MSRKKRRERGRHPHTGGAVRTFIINRTGAPLAANVVRADRWLSRVMGLMFRARLEPGEALWIPRCSLVHTCFMRFRIDLVFLDESLRVTRIAESVGPFRARAGGRDARSVLELAAGTVSRLGLRAGDRLRMTPNGR